MPSRCHCYFTAPLIRLQERAIELSSSFFFLCFFSTLLCLMAISFKFNHCIILYYIYIYFCKTTMYGVCVSRIVSLLIYFYCCCFFNVNNNYRCSFSLLSCLSLSSMILCLGKNLFLFNLKFRIERQ